MQFHALNLQNAEKLLNSLSSISLKSVELFLQKKKSLLISLV